jgi:hypothetical protein
MGMIQGERGKEAQKEERKEGREQAQAGNRVPWDGKNSCSTIRSTRIQILVLLLSSCFLTSVGLGFLTRT